METNAEYCIHRNRIINTFSIAKQWIGCMWPLQYISDPGPQKGWDLCKFATKWGILWRIGVGLNTFNDLVCTC